MLVNPPRGLASVALRMVQVLPSKLYRVSAHSSGEPYFGRNGTNRFDDPTRTKSQRYGTCYLGESLEVAIAETVLHDEMPVGGQFNLATNELERRHCVRFSAGSVLNLVDLTGTALKSLVGSSEISTVLTYDIAQRWSWRCTSIPRAWIEGGGFLISYPDFSDCISDGETVEEALANGRDALKATIDALKAKASTSPTASTPPDAATRGTPPPAAASHAAPGTPQSAP